MIKPINAALLAATFAFSVSSFSMVQAAPSAGAKSPTTATGGGNDTGTNVQSGMSGNGPGGVGSASNPNATNSTPSTSGKSATSKSKKAARHTEKHSTVR